MPKIENRTKKIAITVSVLIAIAIVLVGYFTVGVSAALDDFVFFALLAIISPIALLNYIDYRWRKAVDEHLPDLFRSIVQAQEIGMTLASRSGGRVEKVFDPMGKFIQTTILLEKERKTQTRPYIAIIYVALFVFLFTIVILFKTFFTEVGGMALFSMPTVSPMDLQRTFLHLTLVQGFFGGLVAGKMGEGSISAGLKHSLVMMLLGYVALKFFL
jgi:pilus assembly protein TadC